MTDLSPILDLALLYNPGLAHRDIYTIRLWLNEGCDPDKDILPTMKQLMGKNARIGSFGFFTEAIRDARDKRKAAEILEAKKQELAPDEFADRRKAERIAWLRQRLPHRVECDAALRDWMKAYEAKHGRVEA
ncbi:hypothetical protein [Zavarzinella formosa]|uniref:hypothetical protein n=1 Tax=Zavarzinella formosa TaxID=360055 RepID=UPI0002FF0667|nr:hypothetical protein [Zavarzinella formosa]